MKIRVHPITIVANLWRVLYLSIIPVLRGFFYALQGGLYKWLGSAWVDILLLSAMVLLAVLRWRATSYICDEEGVQVDAGLFFRRSTCLSWERVITLSVIASFYLRPFRAVRLRADSLGGSFKDTDITLLLRPAQAEEIMRLRREPAIKRAPGCYIPRTRSIVALALLTSNSFAGIVFIATFISQSGKLLGEEFSDMLIGTVEEVSRSLAFGIIPPAAVAIAYALLAGWLVGLCLTFVRYKNVVVSRRPHSLRIQGGIFTSREYEIRNEDINFIDIRQSVGTKLLKLYSLYISAVGYGKNKDDISCIIPTEGEKFFERSRTLLFPAFTPAPRSVAPTRQGLMRFIGEPLFYCLGVAAATLFFRLRFPDWRAFILFVGLMALVPAVLYLVVRVFDFSGGGISRSGGYYTIRYSRGFSLHEVIIPVGKIVQVELRQSFMQKFGPFCDLLISTKAETWSVHRCRSLDKNTLLQFFEAL